MDQRIGIGYDIHRLVKGRKLILGGVEIPYARGLDGHSDADVLLHAICDALLGALGRGDIGEHFPNTYPQYKNASSVDLLKKVKGIVDQEGFEVGNVDCVLQAQEPNLKEFKAKMRDKIAAQLNVEGRMVNIKATTMEQLGPIGQKEGIAAFAAVILLPRSTK